jgi:hypothetical protein
MLSPAAAFRTTEEAALRASGALAAAMGGTARLYHEVPANAPLPYVVLGQHQVLLTDGDDCADEAEVFATVAFWSRPAAPDGGAQARAIGAAIVAALAVELTVAGWDVDLWEVISEQYSTDPDQSTRGVVELRYLLTEQVA